MWSRQLILAVVVASAATTVTPSAQSANGAQRISHTGLQAAVSTANSLISVSANRSVPPTVPDLAVINTVDLSTGQFSQCSSSNFDLNVSNGRISLSFVAEGTFTCSVGQRITVSCEATAASGIFHNVLNGTATLNAQHYTTHGSSDTYTGLTCALTAFGVEYVAQGGAVNEQQTTTP